MRLLSSTVWAVCFVQNGVFGCNKVCDVARIDEIRFVLSRSSPFRRISGRQERLFVIEPKLRHAIVIRLVLVSGDNAAMALYQPSKMRNASADRPVDVFPVTKEFLIGKAGFFRNAINQFDHDAIPSHDAQTEPRPQGSVPIGFVVALPCGRGSVAFAKIWALFPNRHREGAGAGNQRYSSLSGVIGKSLTRLPVA